jgi:hypothetical protein
MTTFSIPRPSKFYPNWYFWFENKPSGNPAHYLRFGNKTVTWTFLTMLIINTEQNKIIFSPQGSPTRYFWRLDNKDSNTRLTKNPSQVRLTNLKFSDFYNRFKITGLPGLSWWYIPKRENIFQMTTQCTKYP